MRRKTAESCGAMKQEGEGARTFRTLNVMVSAAFLVNALMYFTTGMPEQVSLIFAIVMLSKLLDLALIYFFFLYVWVTLDFEGKLARWAAKGLPVLLGLETLVILSNLFYPATFLIDEKGFYHAAAAAGAEDIFLIAASVITTVLIIRSKSPRNQKIAALTFIFLPVLNYIRL